MKTPKVEVNIDHEKHGWVVIAQVTPSFGDVDGEIILLSTRKAARAVGEALQRMYTLGLYEYAWAHREYWRIQGRWNKHALPGYPQDVAQSLDTLIEHYKSFLESDRQRGLMMLQSKAERAEEVLREVEEVAEREMCDPLTALRFMITHYKEWAARVQERKRRMTYPWPDDEAEEKDARFKECATEAKEELEAQGKPPEAIA